MLSYISLIDSHKDEIEKVKILPLWIQSSALHYIPVIGIFCLVLSVYIYCYIITWYHGLKRLKK